MVDQALLGSTVAKCMDSIEASNLDEPYEMQAVGIVVVIGKDDHTLTRTYCSDVENYRQRGLFSAALDVVANGDVPSDDPED